MTTDTEPTTDPLIVGLTRPPMVMGVPVLGMLVNFTGVSILFLATNNLLALLLIVPLHSICYLLTLKDDRVFDNLFRAQLLANKCPNRRFWGNINTYSPLPNHSAAG